MKLKVTVCGDNKLYVPEDGCSDCEELEVRINNLESCCATVKEQIESQDASIASIKNTVNNLQPTVSGQGASINSLQKTVDEQGESISTIQTKQDDLDSRTKTLEQEVAVMSAKGKFTGITNTSIKQGSDFDATNGVKAYDSTGAEISYVTIPDTIDTCVVGAHSIAYIANNVDAVVRTVTVTAVSGPAITGASETLKVNPDEEFDPLTGVTATDANGNDVTDTVTATLVS